MRNVIRNATVIFSCLLVWVVGISVSAAADVKHYVVVLSADEGATVSKSQIKAMEQGGSDLLEGQFGVSLIEEFRADKRWFLQMDAPDQTQLEGYLAELNISAENIKESLFVNSPELGGGPKAEGVRDGHTIYMIERDIPGIGLAPQEKMVEVSKGSQGIIEKLGDGIEWDHSYLTDEGTFCVYRAENTDLIQEHASIAGINAKPSAIEHIVRNFNH